MTAGETGNFEFEKTHGSLYGVAGLLGYHTNDGKTIAMMFDVPYDQIFRSNWWNAQVYDHYEEMNESLFQELYGSNGDPIKGDDSHHEKNLSFGYKLSGKMTSGEIGTITLEILKD